MGWQDAPIVGAAPAAPAGNKAAWESAPLAAGGPASEQPAKARPSLLERAADVARLATPAGAVSALLSAGGVGNTVGGLVRGAGSIGATLVDAARSLGDATTDAAPADMRPDVTAGNAAAPRGEELRSGIDAGLRELGADPDSVGYKGGKIAAEVAGTLGVGGALGKTAEAAGAAPQIVRALTTGGMDVGGATGATGLALRAGAGAATGAASAGLVDPQHAGTGAVVGAAAPVVLKGVGEAARAIGRAAAGESAPAAAQQAGQRLAAARDASAAGYVIPPADIPGAPKTMQVVGGLGGKIKTSQVASQRNQQVTNKLARKALGIADDAPLDLDALDAIRKEAGQAYAAVAGLGPMDVRAATLPPGVQVNRFTDNLTLMRRAEVDSGELVRAWKQANHDATGYYRAYSRDANPETLAKAKNAASAAKQIDEFLAARLEQMDKGDMLQALKDARVRIAKTHDVERALNLATGDVSAPKIAGLANKGRPLTGELRTIADAGTAFPKATQQLKEAPGAVSPLDWMFSLGADVTGNRLMNLATLPARPLARSVVLSKAAQERMLKPPTPEEQQVLRLLFNQEVLPAAVRSAPVLLSDRV